jgi:hypothetical protein
MIIKKLLYIVLLTGIIIAQYIGHTPALSCNSDEPFTITATLHLEKQSVVEAILFHRTIGQIEFMMLPMDFNNNIISATIPYNFIKGNTLEYYITASLDDGSGIAFPKIKPVENPTEVLIMKPIFSQKSSTIVGFDSKVIILSPRPNSEVIEDDLLLALSFYNEPNIDTSSIKLFIDGREITKAIKFDGKLLTYIPPKLSNGKHRAHLTFKNLYGLEFTPVSWTFTYVADKISENKKLHFVNSGKFTSDVIHSKIDEETLSIGNAYFDWKANLNWMKVRVKIKQSSLEDDLFQPRNRFSLKLKTPYLTANLGDAYPAINEFTINGRRIRGAEVKLKTKYFKLDYYNGEIYRNIQGDLLDGAMIISNFNPDSSLLEISRDNYTFEQNLLGGNIGFIIPNRFEWDIYFLKIKDNIQSIESTFDNAVIALPTELNNQIQSDMLQYLHSSDTTYAIIIDTTIVGADTNFISLNDTLVTNSILYHNVENVFPYATTLSEDWNGTTPKDNIIVGSNFEFSFDDRRVNVNTGFALSMLNQNTWDPVMTKEEMDTILDDFADCYIGQTYDNVPEDLIWEDCQASSLINPSWDPQNNIVTTGTSLNDLPFNPVDYKDLFHMNMNQIPIIPIDVFSGKITMEQILHMPSLAYHFNLKLNYWNHNFKFSYRQIGPEYYSLANPYLEQDIIEKSFSDRVKLIKNKLFLYVKWKNTKDNIINLDLDKSGDFTQTDVGLSLYPGANLPTLNLKWGNDSRTNGITQVDTVFIAIDDGDSLSYFNQTFDQRVNTRTSRLNIAISDQITVFNTNHNYMFNLSSMNKIDLNEDIDTNDSTYYSPVSTNRYINFNINSILKSYFETNFNVTIGNYSYGAGHSYNEQQLNIFDLLMFYKPQNIIDRIKTGINLSIGNGVSEFTQISFKTGIYFEFYENFLFKINADYRMKYVEEKSYNNIYLTAKLSYLF